MADATKAMHQLDGMDIAGNKIQVKIARAVAAGRLAARRPPALPRPPWPPPRRAWTWTTPSKVRSLACRALRTIMLCFILPFALCFRGVQAPDTGPT